MTTMTMTMMKKIFLLPLLIVLACSFAFSQITVGGNAKIGGAVTIGASSGGGGTTFTHVQGGAVPSNTNTIKCASSGGTGNCTSNVASGDLLQITIEYSATTYVSSDTQSLTWHPFCAASVACGPSGTTADANGCLLFSGSYFCVFYAVATSSGAETVTISSFTTNLTMDEWHRTSGTWTLDVAAGLIGGYNTACSSNASSSVAGAGELIIGAGTGGSAVSYTPTGSLTTLDSSLTTPYPIGVGYTLSGSSGAQTFAFTLSGNSDWTCEGAAFK